MITAVVLCITIALCNGWVPPHTLEDVKKQGELFGTVFLTYIEENAKNFSENISETISDAVRETLNQKGKQTEEQEKGISSGNIPEYSGSPYIEVNGNIPDFSTEKKNGPAYEFYSELDSLGRCGYAESKITPELMPTEERGAIGMIKPTGWHTVKYDNIDGKYLYNRCHLLGYQLTGENANIKNLITGTRYLNVEGMLPFENMVADYVKETDNHVLYRVTPIFERDNLLVSGVQMEAKSVEDNGDGISFNVYCYNVQPDIVIDYKTGESWEVGNEKSISESDTRTYILNTNTKKFHLKSCSSAKNLPDKNREEYSGNRNDLISKGYEPCKKCNP